MKNKIVLVLALAVLMAAPAFAAVQNVKVSGNITSSYLNRSSFNFDQGAVEQYKQSLFLTQAILRVDADLSDNVSTTVGLINERAWGPENNVNTTTETASGNSGDANTNVQLYLASVTLREFLYSPLTLTIGRQVFAFGNSLVFDATGTNNSATGNLSVIAQDLTMRSSLDAVRATLDYKPLTVDLFVGKADQKNVTGAGAKKDDIDVYGVNANYQLGDAMNTVVEAYFFGKSDQSTTSTGGGTLGKKNDTVFAPGLRASTNPIKGLNVQGEVAWQRGTKVISAGDNIQRDAMAAQAMASYTLPVLEKYKPVVSAGYTYVSGDSNPVDATYSGQSSSNKWTAWDPMMENQGGGTIYNTIFQLSNMHIVNAAISASPMADLTAKLSWSSLWADKSLNRQATGSPTPGNGTLPTTYLTQPDGSTFAAKVTSNKDLGQEFDGNLTYAYTEDVTFGLNLGWFFPGGAFDGSNNGSAKQAIASVGVNF